MGCSAEETWHDLYAKARRLEESGQEGMWSAVQHYAEAYDFMPSRLEPVAHLARLYRMAGEHQTAYELSRLILDTPRPQSAAHFEAAIYDVILPLEFILACRALGRHEECRPLVDGLLAIANLPDSIKAALHSGCLTTMEWDRDVHPRSRLPLAFVSPGWWEVV